MYGECSKLRNNEAVSQFWGAERIKRPRDALCYKLDAEMADLPRQAYFFRFAAVFFFAGAFLATFFFGAAFLATFFTVFFTTFLAGAFLTVFLTAFFATFFFAAINVCGENSFK